MSGCSYQGLSRVPSQECATACEGCSWSSTVSSTRTGTTCDFTYSVSRTGCTNQSDETFTGTQSVPCGQSSRLTFYCDEAGACPGYDLVLYGMECP